LNRRRDHQPSCDVTPFDQSQKLHLPGLALHRTSRHTGGKNLIHLCFDGAAFVRPMSKDFILLHDEPTSLAKSARPYAML
jgi:hypothetical protein